MNSGGNAGDPAREQGPRDGEGFDLSNPARSFVRTVRKVFFGPKEFFRRLPTRGRDRNPVAFAIVCALISFPLTLLTASLDPLAADGAPNINEPLAGLVSEPGGAVAAVLVLVLSVLILAPLSALLGLYIGAAIYHILVKIFVGPAETNFYTTLRVVAYTSAVALLSWIPVAGLFVSLYGLYLTFVGIREMHETTTARALAVMLLPVVLTLLVTLPGLLSVTNS